MNNDMTIMSTLQTNDQYKLMYVTICRVKAQYDADMLIIVALTQTQIIARILNINKLII